MNYNRRSFIKKLSILYGSILLYPSCAGDAPPFRVFTRGEADCLMALCEQIIPADHDAGATEAGVIYFIDRQTHLRFTGDLPVFQKGIAALQATCEGEYGLPFEKTEPSTQVEIMRNMERGRLPAEYWEDAHQQTFFNLTLNRTMQGFYGSPRHGGNKNYVSYRMLRLDYPLVVGQNRYRDGK